MSTIRAKSESTFTSTTATQMLRGKFWSGLASDHVKSATRHKFDGGVSFEELLKAARSIEMEHENKDLTALPTSQLHATNDTSKKLEEILKQLRSLDGRIQKLERTQSCSKQPGSASGGAGSSQDRQKSQLPGNSSRNRPVLSSTIRCYHCGEIGHKRPECPLKE